MERSHCVEIHPSFCGSASLEVVAFPADERFPPVTLTRLPVVAEEGAIEIVIPEGEEFDGEIFVFEYFAGSWQESREDEDIDLNFGLTIAV